MPEMFAFQGRRGGNGVEASLFWFSTIGLVRLAVFRSLNSMGSPENLVLPLPALARL